MKKKGLLIICILLIVTILIILIIHMIQKNNNLKNNIETTKYYVSDNKWLKTHGNKLVNKDNKVIQLRGVSSHGIQWYSKLYNRNNLKKLKDEWRINVFRVSMYPNIYDNGYMYDKTLINDVVKIVDNAIELDMYVIIDWHTLNDNDPLMYENDAVVFFETLAEKYKNKPNVIFEICNEPNGNDVTWKKNVKPYAEKVIKAIRKHAKRNLIIVGTPNWCKDLENVSKDPLKYDNVIYSVHFYAGDDDSYLQAVIDDFRNNNLPVFISECGMTDNTGDGEIYEDRFREWIKYINENKISWVYWSLSNKDESSALLSKKYKKGSSIDNYISDTGKIIKQILLDY